MHIYIPTAHLEGHAKFCLIKVHFYHDTPMYECAANEEKNASQDFKLCSPIGTASCDNDLVHYLRNQSINLLADERL